jgi:hypothetical protein
MMAQRAAGIVKVVRVPRQQNVTEESEGEDGFGGFLRFPCAPGGIRGRFSGGVRLNVGAEKFGTVLDESFPVPGCLGGAGISFCVERRLDRENHEGLNGI